jgi:hypothetical protein
MATYQDQQPGPSNAAHYAQVVLAWIARVYLGILALVMIPGLTKMDDDPMTRVMRWAMIVTVGAVALAWFGLGERRRLRLMGAAALGGAMGAAFSQSGVTDFFGNLIAFLIVWPFVVALPVGLALYGIAGGSRARATTIPEPYQPPAEPVLTPPVFPPRQPEPAPFRAAPAEPHANPELDADAARIHERLRAIDGQRERIDGVQALLEREVGGAALAPVREKLAYAEEVLLKQRARHEARLWAIDLVRWQHALARFVEHATDATLADAERRLQELAGVVKSGNALLQTWERQPDIAATQEGERCIGHLRELLGRCEEVRQGIVVQQAMLAIRGIAPTDDEVRSTALSTEPLESLQSELGPNGSLAASLASFEAEHERLREDQETAQDVERFLKQLEGGRI